MKGIIILILILAVIGIWWAKRDPEPVGSLQPEAVNADNTDSVDYQGGSADDNVDSGGEYEDKG